MELIFKCLLGICFVILFNRLWDSIFLVSLASPVKRFEKKFLNFLERMIQ